MRVRKIAARLGLALFALLVFLALGELAARWAEPGPMSLYDVSPYVPSERLVQEGLARLLGGGADSPTRRPADDDGAAGPAVVVPEGESRESPAQRRTALIIAHRLSTVEIADRVLVVHDGRVVEDGSPEQLIRDGGRFAALHGAWRDSLV